MRLLDDLRALGFEVEAIGERVRVRHQAPTPPEAARPLLEELRRRKPEVLAALTMPEGQPAPARPPMPLVDAGDPGGALWWHLDTWAGMNEAEWSREEVNALYNAILAFWTDYPSEAESWWREWRAAHPGARLA